MVQFTVGTLCRFFLSWGRSCSNQYQNLVQRQKRLTGPVKGGGGPSINGACLFTLLPLTSLFRFVFIFQSFRVEFWITRARERESKVPWGPWNSLEARKLLPAFEPIQLTQNILPALVPLTREPTTSVSISVPRKKVQLLYRCSLSRAPFIVIIIIIVVVHFSVARRSNLLSKMGH